MKNTKGGLNCCFQEYGSLVGGNQAIYINKNNK